jgi:deoxyribonuclease-4
MRVLDAYHAALGDAAMKQMHIHLSGIEYGPRGEKNHLIMEEADLDFKALFRALHEAGAGGRLLCESPVLEVDALKFRQLWMEISGEQE